MIARAAVCFFFALATVAAGQVGRPSNLPQIPTPEILAIEMAKALVAGDRQRFTALAATREEMEQLLETHQPPINAEDRRHQKEKVAEIVADRKDEFDRFQAMKKKANVREGVPVRFELISLDKPYVKDGMTKIRHSRLRMLQGTEPGKTETFLIALDDMFIFPRGWAFTSVRPGIGREADVK